MAKQIDSYKQAIVRILNLSQLTVGTGFLIAPGYVVTCAHVVLQAVGVGRADYVNYADVQSLPELLVLQRVQTE